MRWCYAYEMKFHLQIYSVILKLGSGANAPIAPWVIRYCKELKVIIPKMKSFPVHHEVRFAQHLIQLCEAVLSNIDGCRLNWEKIVDAPREEYDGKEKDKARGFLKTWHA